MTWLDVFRWEYRSNRIFCARGRIRSFYMAVREAFRPVPF